jgi:sulfatase maturation enzyme AslB (radical SAM superfamily)
MCVKSGHSDRIKLRFNTNGLTTAERHLELYTCFKNALIHLSVDGVGAYHDLIRYPSNWTEMEKKLDWWDNTPDNIDVTIDTTASVLNVMHIPDLVKWKVEKQFKKINKFPTNRGLIGLHFLHSPDILNVTVLPKHLKQLVNEKYNELFDWLGADVVNKYKKFHALLDFMNSKDNSHMWPRTLEYLDNMDSIRQTDWKSVLLDYDKTRR